MLPMTAMKTTIEPGKLRERVSIRAREYAALTGTPLPSVYRYIANGQIRAARIGGTWHIPVAAVRALVGTGE
jgi:excisionase family DNA binding protein